MGATGQHKYNIVCIIGIPEGEEEEQGIENLFEKVNRKLHKLGEVKSHASPGSTQCPNQDETGPLQDTS